MTISFTRLLNTGDALDFPLVNSGLFLLWAYALSPGASPTDYQIHDVFGSVYLNFFNYTPAVRPTTPAPPPAGNGTYTSPEGDFTMHWTFDVTNTYAYITMAAAAGSGYVSVGFNLDRPLMAGSDMLVFLVLLALGGLACLTARLAGLTGWPDLLLPATLLAAPWLRLLADIPLGFWAGLLGLGLWLTLLAWTTARLGLRRWLRRQP